MGSAAVWLDDVTVYAYSASQPFQTYLPPTATPPPLLPTTTPQPPPVATATPVDLSTLTWVNTGGPLGGLGYDVRMRPDNPDIMFVTDAKAGVFKSTDGGQNWYPSNNGITARTGETGELIPVFSLTIDPNNPDIVWAGTQAQRGVFKSTDGGENWAKMDKGIIEQGLSIRGFSVEPGNSDVVYLAAEVSSWDWARQFQQGRQFELVQGTVYKTTDGGKIWKKVWHGNNLARYIWIDPRNTDVVYVSTGIFDREAANSEPQAGIPGGVGVLKSTDGGQTWQQVNNGLNNLYIGTLFMHPQNPDILLAGAFNVQYPEGSGVYLTRDGGKTWNQTLFNNQAIESVEFSLSNPQIAYAGSINTVFRSEDGGQSWEEVANRPEGGDWGAPGVVAGHPIDFQVDPRDPDRIFSNQYGGGNFLSLDGGHTWQTASKGYTGSMVRGIAVDPTQPGRVVAASRSGLFISNNGGSDWVGISNPNFHFLDWHVIALDPADPQHMLSGLTTWHNLVNSSNGGQTWEEVARTPADRMAFSYIAFVPSHPERVYAATAGIFSSGRFDDIQPGAGIYISNDSGRTWQPSSDPAIRDIGFARLAVHPQDPNLIYAAAFRKGLLRSPDGGQSWSLVGGLPPNQSYTAIRFDPRDGNILFAGRAQGGLYRSSDGGQSWTLSGIGMPPEAFLTDMLFDPNDSQILYTADLFSGVYRSVDGGKRWRAINNGLALRAVNALALSADGLHLYAGTEGNGVYRLDLNGQPPAEAPLPTPIPSATPTNLPTAEPSVAESEPTVEPSAVESEPTAEGNKANPFCPASTLPFLAVVLFQAGKCFLRR